MDLNLPIAQKFRDCENILIAGAGGGFDIFAGLPIYFNLVAAGKQVHLASYSFTSFPLAMRTSSASVLLEDVLISVEGPITAYFSKFFAEGYLSQWFQECRQENVPVWLFAKTGAVPIIEAYQVLVKHLNIDAIVLVDGGVDSLMRGDEAGPGTFLEDSITMAAVNRVDVPVKILSCLGFSTEIEEGICHHDALENIADLTKNGGFLGTCSLTPEMEAFLLYEKALHYVWGQPNHNTSRIQSRVLKAVRGEFGEDGKAFLSSFMSMYWFFQLEKVIEKNLLIKELQNIADYEECFEICRSFRQSCKIRKQQQWTLP